MANAQPWKAKGLKKDEWLAEEVAKAVGAGKVWNCETVDFSDPDRPPTCIEVDFPIIPINQISAIEGAAAKPVYQVSKWWARRRSSVFRSMLLASAIKAPDDPADAAKLVWDAYYGNHQQLGAFNNLSVADVFMGGGTTVIEGSRLGMQMYGTDLNPVAWFIVKTSLAQVSRSEVEALLDDLQAEVMPKIMPYYACNCPRGHRGQWTKLSTGEMMDEDFDPLKLTFEERSKYRYHGPELVYTFWSKHGPCQVTGCGHRTPIMSSPVMATKTLTVKSWPHTCRRCGCQYDLEERDVRMAPDVPLVIAETERPFSVAQLRSLNGPPSRAKCPSCGDVVHLGKLGKATRKNIELTLLVHPQWIYGENATDEEGRHYGGTVDDALEATIYWNQKRAEKSKLIEVRGKLPAEVVCPDTGITVHTGRAGGTVPKKSSFSCAKCGTLQDILASVRASGTTGPVAMYAYQGYCPFCASEEQAYNGRFFAEARNPTAFNSAAEDWESSKNRELSTYWPNSELPFGFMTHMNNGGLPNHGLTHWWKMFNPRQLVLHAMLVRAICELESDKYDWAVRESVLAAWEQYLQAQNMGCWWNIQTDRLAVLFSTSNYHPKSTLVEGGFPWAKYGHSRWVSCVRKVLEAQEWRENPTELVITEYLRGVSRELRPYLPSTKSIKLPLSDSIVSEQTLETKSATDLTSIADDSLDIIITDPPFGGLLHYSELSDFFYVWLRLALHTKYPHSFKGEFTPKTLEAVANRARQPGRDRNSGIDNADKFYQRLLTASWKESHRVLKAGGLLSFTFHHSDDAPWVSVLESLFDAGFYLEATYPIRSDQTKGEGAKPGTFGSQTIEYDIIHVCRKRHEEPRPVSWAKLRRQILSDIWSLRSLLEHHEKEGLLEADLQVIRRGKALEYFSRHHGKVYKDQETPMSVLEGLLGINQLLDEENGSVVEAPPYNAEPFTRMLLRLFDGISELPRDQMQKFLRGTGCTPGDLENRGWIYEKKKIFNLTPPLTIAQEWFGKPRVHMQSDYDQAAFLIGACFEGSGINASETLNNENFTPHPALGAILAWFKTHGVDASVRNAAITAERLYLNWASRNQNKVEQLSMFDALGEEVA